MASAGGTSHGQRGLAATAATVVLALGGVACVGVALVREQHRQQPPLSVVDRLGPAGDQPGRRIHPGSGPVEAPVLTPSAPISLAIPVIGVQSTLLHLGQTVEGALEVPKAGPHYDDAGWYKYSPAPGSLGPAIIVGHVDSASDGPSVFFRLGLLRPSDSVRIARADGSVAVFAVDSVQRFDKNRFPSDLVYGDTDHAALRLITCGGPFDRASGHHRDNVVVLASLVGAEVSAQAAALPRR